MERLFSTKDVCAIFKISPSTLTRWVLEGNFPAPQQIYPHSSNRWTETVLNKVIKTMPVAEAYKNSGYQEGQRA